LPTRSVGPTDRSASLLVGQTHLSGTTMSLVGGDLGVPMSHKDIFNNERPLPTTDMVKLTEECSAAILKKNDPGCPSISCSIGPSTLKMHYATLEPVLASCLR
jgi:hypothetical protein